MKFISLGTTGTLPKYPLYNDTNKYRPDAKENIDMVCRILYYRDIGKNLSTIHNHMTWTQAKQGELLCLQQNH